LPYKVKPKQVAQAKRRKLMAYLGIDVSKDTLAVKLLLADGQQEQGEYSNSASGFKKLGRWLKPHQVEGVHVCMEATNIYWEEVAQYLHDQGYKVSVVNPARIKGFAQSQLRRHKTDKVDADVIAQFCQAITPSIWVPPTPEQRKLRALVRHQKALQKTLTQQTNRLATCTEPAVKSSLELIITTLSSEIERLQVQIQDFIDDHPTLKQQFTLLISITGIGPKTAIGLLAEMYDLADYDSARSAAADAGLTPSHYSSGKTVHRKSKLSKMGKSSVRGLLYFPAITALQHNPIIQALKQRLQAQGKAWKVILGAAMRKLVHLAYGVLKNQTPFDPNFLNNPSPST
jgi:transposase